MALSRALLFVVAAPLAAVAQPDPADVVRLRNQATVDGSVEVKVTTRAVAEAAVTLATLTPAQRIAIQRAQQKVLLLLLPRGLLVGNEIRVEPDGSFTMRVLPSGLDYLAASADVAALNAAAQSRGAQR